MLAQRRLGWFGDEIDDVPLAVSGETGGPGDDIRIEFGTRFGTTEAQVKHGLQGGSEIDAILDRVASKSIENDDSHIAIVAGGKVSETVYPDLADDLDQLRSSRDDTLHAEAKRLLAAGRDKSLLGRIHVVKQDLDNDRDGHLSSVLTLLSTLLVDPDQTKAAWAVLTEDADKICAKQRRRTSRELRGIVEDVGKIRLKPPAKDARFVQQLDETQQLLEDDQVQAGLVVLHRIKTSIAATDVTTTTRLRLLVLQGLAAVRSDDDDQAFDLANQALEIDATYVPAMLVGAMAALKLGKSDDATRLANGAVAIDGDNSKAWQTKVQVDAALGLPLVAPPPDVASSADYQEALMMVAINAGDWERVARLTAGLLADGDRSVDVLRYRCFGLMNTPDAGDGATRDRLLEVEQLATEIINKPGIGLAMKSDAYNARGLARRGLNLLEQAKADFQRAYESDPRNENSIRNQAASLVESNRVADAAAVMRAANLQDPTLIAMRATLRYETGDKPGAKVDLEEAERRTSKAIDVTDAKIVVAGAMAQTGDADGALRVVASISANEGGFRLLVVRGAVAFLQDQVDQAIEHYRAAAAIAPPSDAHTLLIELGMRLFRARRYPDAVAAFDDAGGLELVGDEPRQFFAASLMAINDLVRAQGLVDDEVEKGRTLPAWVLAVAVDVAMRSDDIEAAIQRLTELVAAKDSIDARIMLAKTLVDAGRISDARIYIDALSAVDNLAPIERIQVAELMRLIGRQLEAVEVGFRAFRADPQDPKIQRSFASLVVTCEEPIPSPAEVGANTFVLLRDDRGNARSHTIYEDGPVEPLRNELTLESASKLGLLGKKVGERLAAPEQRDWADKGWTVESILASSVHAAQDIVEHYEERFPSEPFFVTSIAIGDGTGIKDFVPLIGAVNARRQWVESVLEKSREMGLPLGFTAKQVGAAIPEIMDGAMLDGTHPGSLVVEWSPEQDQRESVLVAVRPGTVVLTRSALHTAQALDLLSILGDGFDLAAPRSLDWELRTELEKAEREVVSGVSTLMPGGPGFQMQEVEANSPMLVRRRDNLRALVSWLEASVSIKSRPLSMVFGKGTDEDNMREFIGHSSFDAIALTLDVKGAVYADDIGLRRVLIQQNRARSFSTISLVHALAGRQALTPAARDALLLRLINTNYVYVLPTSDLLIAAVSQPSPMTVASLQRAFALLATVSTPRAARMAGATLKAFALRQFTAVQIEVLVDLALTAMHSRASMPLCAHLLMQSVEFEFRLLPIDRERVRRACAAAVKP
jgi:tetratricopeptide (TPR) repeat protein